MAEGKPVRERPNQLSRSVQLDQSLRERVGKRLVAEPNSVHCQCVGTDNEVDLETGRVPTDGRLFRLQKEPVAAGDSPREVELDDDPPIGQAVLVETPVHVPQEELGIEIALVDERIEPSMAPLSESDDHVVEILARVREVVLRRTTSWREPALDQPGAFQESEPLRQKRA